MSDISFTVFKGNKDGSITRATTTRPALTGDQVHVEVTASGCCGTDLHYRTAGIALGHEGVGKVVAIGPDVKSMKVGDRVGWGYQHNSCGQCHQCLTGRETFCEERAMYASADTDQGSFATGAVWREAFLFPIPDGLDDVTASPLQCGGATVFNALHMYPMSPTERIGIVGVGGLGSIAIQFASKMGAEVVVFSGTSSKKDEALRLGAKEFHSMKDEGKDLKKDTKPINRLLVTTSAQPDWAAYMPVLAPGAIIFPLGVSGGDFKIPYMAMLAAGITVQGSIVAPRWCHRQMLEFAARHQIVPVIQKFEMSEEGITEALDRLDKGDIRYRGVLVPKEKL